MKIALQFGMPESQQLQLLIQAAKEIPELGVENKVSGDAGARSTIAAYDLEKLVGIGTRIHSSLLENAMPSFYFLMDPGYANRGIQSNMMKLLSISQPTLALQKKHRSISVFANSTS